MLRHRLSPGPLLIGVLLVVAGIAGGTGGLLAAPATGYLVYAANDGNIWRMNADGSGRTALTNDGTANHPMWVGGGSQIVFSSGRDQRTATAGDQTIQINQLYLMGSDGSRPRLISDGTGDDRFADVYSNSQRLVFLRDRNYRLVNGALSYDVQVLTMRLDGTDVQGVAVLPGTPQVRYDTYPPRISPDGRTLVMVRQAQGQNASLLLMDMATGSQTPVTPDVDQGTAPGSVQYLWPRWTPDGKLAMLRRVYSFSLNDNKLMIMDRQGRNAQVVLAGFNYEALASGFDVDWAGGIVFAARSPDLPGGQRPEEVYTIQLSNGEFSAPLDSGHAPDWSATLSAPPTDTPVPPPPTATLPPMTATPRLSPVLPTPSPSRGSPTARPGSPTAVPTPLIATADPLFYRVWERMDRAVVENRAARSWTWGPQARTGGSQEPYAGQPNNARLVQYFDKARMERMQPANGGAAYVTNGLLVVELMSGKMQVGDTQYEDRAPSGILVSGDGENNPSPSYALLGTVASLGGENQAPDRTGQPITATLVSTGTLGTVAPALADKARAAQFIPQTAHNIPDVFWTFLNQRGLVYQNGGYGEDTLYDWVFTMGYPVTEPYWTKQRVAGKELDVLVQAFQRQVLTYTPANDPQWQVQFGNVGQHYYTWRYGKAP